MGGGGRIPADNQPTVKHTAFLETRWFNQSGRQSENFLYCQELSTDSLRNPVPSWGQRTRKSLKNEMNCCKVHYPLKNKYMKMECNVKDWRKTK